MCKAVLCRLDMLGLVESSGLPMPVGYAVIEVRHMCSRVRLCIHFLFPGAAFAQDIRVCLYMSVWVCQKLGHAAVLD